MTSAETIPDEVRRAYGLGPAERVSMGWINQTFRGEGEAGPLIVQRLHPIFSPEVNLDLEAVGAHLATRSVETPRLVRTREGAPFVEVGHATWRAITRLEGETFERLDTPARLESAGRLLARFHHALDDLDHEFHFVRAGVHDTEAHLARLRARLDRVESDVDRAEARSLAHEILAHAEGLDLSEPGRAPQRVVHGDPKASNILFRGETAVAMLDLDTLGRGPLEVELGDALRSWSTSRDEADPETECEPDRFEAAISGYLGEARAWISAAETRAFARGAETIALELASRFALDAFEDTYFGWDPTRFPSRIAHNTARARAQLAFARSARDQRPALEAKLEAALASR